MGDVALLVDPVEQVRHRSNRPDTDVVPAVSFRLDGLTGGLEVGEVGCLVPGERRPLYVSPVSWSTRSLQLLKPGPVTCSTDQCDSEAASNTEEKTLYRN